jgi:chloramphenicol-sensitive protein RarD
VTSTADEVRRGTAYGVLAYGVWGLFPLYFHALKPAGAWEVLAHRIVWTMLLCLVVLMVRRDWAWTRDVVRRPALAGGLTLAALFIAVNWVIYVFAVLHGHTYEAALGYFLNPILTVALGVVVLGEGLRPLQWVAVAIGAVAAGYLAVEGGHFPVVALSLAASFGLYSLLKKRLGVSLQPWHTLFAETAVLTPVAGVILLVIARQGEMTYGAGPRHTVLLTLAGVVTALPLLCFAAAAQRVPLVTIGLMQFITPVIQLLIGVLVLGERVSAALWVGFGIVWLALTVLTVDSVAAARRGRSAPAVVDPPAADLA